MLPHLVGIDFLKHNEILLPVTQKMVDDALREVEWVHSKTISKDKEKVNNLNFQSKKIKLEDKLSKISNKIVEII